MSAVCSGFLYGLAVADGLIGTGAAGRILLIGADTFSTILNPGDRSTGAVFGDGAGAVVLRGGDPAEAGAVRHVELGSDGGLADLITVRAGGSRLRRQDASAAEAWFAMQGQAVYRHAVRRMTASARDVLDRTGWTPDDVDLFIAHQANLRILDTVAAELGIGPDRVYANVQDVGNTAAASIPLALAHAVTDKALDEGHRVLLAAFGGGATWGAATLVWPRLTSDHFEQG
ncbi:3-oxoacyl-[acyl-carrier-protein] synthase III C-terminal domain-containing protein [Sphaerisporangium sp. NPDC051017]|uniref:3-oxoacyl-[acyl-carrier-protein] synthase III C-terminal domain-containing protein n=1 Tax=Sphaerisporangium sp. NPDC051017 TaxID=3154636 RepID=UPI0034233681